MSKKFLQFIVIFLAILIIFCFIALVYGVFLKISNKDRNNGLHADTNNISLNLGAGEKIIDMQVIDENTLLITITNSADMRGLIYNFKENKILKFIEK